MPTVARRVINWAAAFEDGAIIRAAFFGLLTATGVILYLDYTDLNARQPFATAESAIGVHQIYAAAPTGSPTSQLQAAGNAMSEAQTMTAQISRYLASMGVADEVWLRALETPPDRLTYFTTDELKRLNLATRLTK